MATVTSKEGQNPWFHNVKRTWQPTFAVREATKGWDENIYIQKDKQRKTSFVDRKTIELIENYIGYTVGRLQSDENYFARNEHLPIGYLEWDRNLAYQPYIDRMVNKVHNNSLQVYLAYRPEYWSLTKVLQGTCLEAEVSAFIVSETEPLLTARDKDDNIMFSNTVGQDRLLEPKENFDTISEGEKLPPSIALTLLIDEESTGSNDDIYQTQSSNSQDDQDSQSSDMLCYSQNADGTLNWCSSKDIHLHTK